MKRIIIAVVLCVSALFVPMHAFVVDGFNYEITGSNKVALIAMWPTYSGNVNVPQTITYNNVSYTVTEIGDGAFRNAEFLTSVTLCSTIVKIGASAFENCIKLESVKIPSNVAEMGSRVFAGCTSLASVTFVGNKLSEIPNSAFYNCSSLKDVIVPGNVKAIRSLAFAGSGLKSISIGPELKLFEPFAFEGCRSMTSVKISDLRAWCDIDILNASDNPLYYAHTLILNNQAIEYLEIPESITTIKPFIFAGCRANKLNIPSSVTTVDLSAFLNCHYITDVVIPNSVTELITTNINEDEHPFPNMVYLRIGKNVKKVPSLVFGYSYRLRELVLLDGVEELDYDTFKYSKVVNVVLPSTAKILRSSFNNCNNLESVTINAGLKVMDHNVFAQCKMLREIHCRVSNPDKIEFIGPNQFAGVDMSTCVLYVPENSIALYKAHPNWRNFNNIVADVYMTDVDRSGITDVEDVNLVINIMLKEDDPACNNVSADVDGNGMVDIEDLNAILNKVLHLD